jgi:2-oxoglutarate/2-oxoacid ferredoxin oxidoreductase subunit beta
MSQKSIYDMEDVDIAWCPGCGNFAYHRIIKSALSELEMDPHQIVFVSGIGQAAKLPQYTRTHMFNGLHGRALPAAMAINACNPDLKVIAYSGDGCTYGEGGNHFIHQILRNPNMTDFVSTNMIYGLTKGQASPTSLKGLITPVQVEGVTNEPFNPLAVAISLGATFVARIYVGDIDASKEIVKKALQHRGFALVDAFNPCVSFNKFNTYQWYKEHSYYLDEAHDPTDQKAAFAKALETDPYPLGLFYLNEGKPVFTDNLPVYRENKDPLYKREVDMDKLKTLIESKSKI